MCCHHWQAQLETNLAACHTPITRVWARLTSAAGWRAACRMERARPAKSCPSSCGASKPAPVAIGALAPPPRAAAGTAGAKFCGRTARSRPAPMAPSLATASGQDGSVAREAGRVMQAPSLDACREELNLVYLDGGCWTPCGTGHRRRRRPGSGGSGRAQGRSSARWHSYHCAALLTPSLAPAPA